MSAVRYIVQTESGRILGQFESMLETEQYVLPRGLRIVGRQSIARRPSLASYVVDHAEYPSEMLEVEYEDIIIVRDRQEEYLRYAIGVDFADFERRMMIMGNWSIYPDEKVKSNNEEREKAHKLLLECLNEQEKEELESFETVTISTEIGLFRIKMEGFDHSIPPAFNAIYKGKRYCAVIEEGSKYPRGDHYIAQILLIRTNPKKFLALANKE